MARLVILLVIALLVFAGLRLALRKKQLTVKQFFSIYFATLVGIALLFLALFDAPADLGASAEGAEEMPAEMLGELANLGLV